MGKNILKNLNEIKKNIADNDQKLKKNNWLTMTNNNYIGYQQEFTFLTIHTCIQQSSMEFLRPATEGL